jgi:hypothetical protein
MCRSAPGSQTFIAGLRCHGLTAPGILDAPMNGCIFETCIETQLAATVSPGDMVILDNVAFHRSQRAEDMVKARVPGCYYCRLTLQTSTLSNGPLETQNPAAQRAARSFDAITQARRHLRPLFDRRMPKLLQSSRL